MLYEYSAAVRLLFMVGVSSLLWGAWGEVVWWNSTMPSTTRIGLGFGRGISGVVFSVSGTVMHFKCHVWYEWHGRASYLMR